ncbi:type II toxin-antitoxin system RelE/ParE family toxin [Inquilinus sp. Marseille-Q2685]|uniref:type II toxin-antitoxin system RelE/ParE family toxin n=1 Tax=Inquilinus sp. Marseille-Q2685 TaxID=2866581 RepID=UPI001CE3B64B|nr:type II toxin-antitoxin system RelE/ParE family toxin [Inquilinus sp. Marseille-Q2685]
MRTVVWSDAARRDYLDIIRYISEDDPFAADSVADRLDAAASRLAHMPTGRRGRIVGTYEKIVTGLPYIIAYAIGASPTGGEAVTILHVIMARVTGRLGAGQRSV